MVLKLFGYEINVFYFTPKALVAVCLGVRFHIPFIHFVRLDRRGH